MAPALAMFESVDGKPVVSDCRSKFFLVVRAKVVVKLDDRVLPLQFGLQQSLKHREHADSKNGRVEVEEAQGH